MNNNWKDLCDNFLNNFEWQLENRFSDTRVSDIDPSKASSEPFSPEKLRKMFSKMRSQYSLFHDRYHRSGLLEEGNEDGIDDFFENFVKGDVVYFYAHLLFKGQPPRFCTRDLAVKCDIGVPEFPLISSSNNAPYQNENIWIFLRRT